MSEDKIEYFKESNKSTECLIEQESKDQRSSNNISEENRNRDFVLNKFFQVNNEKNEGIGLFPVPKPRTKIKKIISPPASHQTFKITSAKKTKTQEEITVITSRKNSDASSISSTATFKVTVPKILKNVHIKNTFFDSTDEVKNEPKVGDIILHNKGCISPENSTRKVINVRVKNREENENDEEFSENDSAIPENKRESDESELKAKYKNEDNKEEKSTINNDNNKVIKFVIHKTDKLQLNSLVVHPVVKIHIVDIRTGNYFSKKNKKRPVVYYCDSNLSYIAPTMTQPFDLQKQRSMFPAWEETIIINEDFDYILAEKENIIIFFEILDFVSSSSPFIENNKEMGWHEIAFAFLKIHGKNNATNLEKRMRLQLYHQTSAKKDTSSSKCSLWNAWRKNKMKKYKSSLHVTIKSTKTKKTRETPFRSLDAFQKEVGKINDDFSHKNVKMANSIEGIMNIKNEEWRNKTKSSTCLLPNKRVAEIQTESSEGCLTLKFSNNGSFIACALKIEELYSLVVFSVSSAEEICHFPGHQDLIYAMCWSSDDKLIIAASADSSVSVWDVEKVKFMQILPHPNFVYTCDLNDSFIVTGCYDKMVRIWGKEGERTEFVLNQELEGHKGFVTCVLFKKTIRNALFSSDSTGLIIEWVLDESSNNVWSLLRTITLGDIQGIVINQIILFGNDEKRLLIHSRDSILRIVDLKTSLVLKWFQGGLNRRFQTSCSISPCERYVVAGSENSLVNIWKLKSGKYVGNLTPFKNKTVTINCVQFHPKENLIAVAHFGSEEPILIFGHDDKIQDTEIDLRLIGNQNRAVSEKPSRTRQESGDSFGNYKNVLLKFDKLMSRHPQF